MRRRFCLIKHTSTLVFRILCSSFTFVESVDSLCAPVSCKHRYDGALYIYAKDLRQKYESPTTPLESQGTAVNYIKWHEDLHASEPGYKEQSSASPPKPCIPVAGIEFCLSGESRTVLFSPSLQEMPLIACSGDTGGVLGKTTHLGKELKLRAIGGLGRTEAF